MLAGRLAGFVAVVMSPTLSDSCPSLGRGVPRRLVAKRREIVKDVGTYSASEQDYRVGAIAVATIDNRIADKGGQSHLEDQSL